MLGFLVSCYMINRADKRGTLTLRGRILVFAVRLVLAMFLAWILYVLLMDCPMRDFPRR